MVLKVVEGKPSTYVVAQTRRIPFSRLAAPRARARTQLTDRAGYP